MANHAIPGPREFSCDICWHPPYGYDGFLRFLTLFAVIHRFCIRYLFRTFNEPCKGCRAVFTGLTGGIVVSGRKAHDADCAISGQYTKLLK